MNIKFLSGKSGKDEAGQRATIFLVNLKNSYQMTMGSFFRQNVPLPLKLSLFACCAIEIES
jgi:hypothetical protein